jgi:hypothetical protein
LSVRKTVGAVLVAAVTACVRSSEKEVELLVALAATCFVS